MGDLFDDVCTYCKSFGDDDCEENGTKCKFDKGVDGCAMVELTGEMPMFWSDEDRESINKTLSEHHTSIESGGAGYSISQKHYVAKSPIEFMQTLMSKEMFVGFCIGNTIKYLMRAPFKGQFSSDFDKARQYSWWASLARKGKVIDPSEPVPKDFKTRVFIC
ncbi:MAG: DUF3310 domain-containing protein [Anaerovibrio sp.]